MGSVEVQEGGGVWNSSRRMHIGASGEASGPRCAKDIDAVCVFITPLRPSTSSSSRPRPPPPVVERRRVATPKHAHTHTHTWPGWGRELRRVSQLEVGPEGPEAGSH